MIARALIAGAVAVAAAAIVAASPMAAPDSKPPRIVAAMMQDRDGDGRADRLRVTYSERVRHVADRDGRYPFQVSGYRVRSVGRAGGSRVVVVLVEKTVADGSARPSVRYRRTKSRPVADRAGNQARGQVFARTRAHGSGPVNPTPVTPDPTLPLNPTSADRDGDGTANEQDCAPDDPKRHPKAVDLPDLAFVDANCDGIDGTETKAIFVSPQGKDANPGTKAAPKREIQAAVVAAAAAGKDVYAADGSYGRVEVATGVGVYGGYNPQTWKRNLTPDTTVAGTSEGIYAAGDTGVVLQLLTVRGSNPGQPGTSAYGIRAINGSRLSLQRVVVAAGAAASGVDGANGSAGVVGGPGGNGGPGQCDGSDRGDRGAPGASPAGFPGGAGGLGGWDYGSGSGTDGTRGAPGTPGGAGGPSGDPGRAGLAGTPGVAGASGANGEGGSSTLSVAKELWIGGRGSNGTDGKPGHGGGGGGGGGAQMCFFCDDGTGNGGGGGGGGGRGGTGGRGAGAGGGTFGLYLFESTATVSDSSSIAAGNGGAGGRGGDGGLQGEGGDGGLGATYCRSEIGEGGNGGRGGDGGQGGGGGGGAGGPSVAIFKVAGSKATVSADSTLQIGAPGLGGAGGIGGNGTRTPGQAGLAQLVYG